MSHALTTGKPFSINISVKTKKSLEEVFYELKEEDPELDYDNLIWYLIDRYYFTGGKNPEVCK